MKLLCDAGTFGQRLLEGSPSNVICYGDISGNCFTVFTEDEMSWSLFTDNNKVVLKKSEWRFCRCGDHLILLMDLRNNLYHFHPLENKSTFICSTNDFNTSQQQLFDYQCRYAVFVHESGDVKASKFILFSEKEHKFDIAAELTLPYRITALSCGKEHAIMLDSNGRVYTVGANVRGQLGVGGTELINSSTPVRVDLLFGLRISLIAAGGWHSLAVDGDSNSVYSWGWNESGQLGKEIGGSVATDVPSIVDLIEDCEEAGGGDVIMVTKIACGSRHSLVIAIMANDDNRKTVLTFGSNVFGQLRRSSAADGVDKQQFDWHPARIECDMPIINAFAFGYATALITTQ